MIVVLNAPTLVLLGWNSFKNVFFYCIPKEKYADTRPFYWLLVYSGTYHLMFGPCSLSLCQVIILLICEKTNEVIFIYPPVRSDVGLTAKHCSIRGCGTTEEAVNAGLDQLKRLKQGLSNGTGREIFCLKALNQFRKQSNKQTFPIN